MQRNKDNLPLVLPVSPNTKRQRKGWERDMTLEDSLREGMVR